MIASGVEVPYVLFLTAGLVPWFFFQEGVNHGMMAMIEYNYLVKKVVFNISVLPIIKVIGAWFTHIFFVGILILVSSLLSATVAAFAGPVSFVGIAMPHVARTALRSSDPRAVIPASFMLGMAFCLLSDMLARSLFAPTELSISTVTAVFGAPIVIGMLLKRRRADG